MGGAQVSEVYVVVVEHNLVKAIERLSEVPDRPVPGTPLEVSTELANNSRLNGCIDGRYYFDDTQRARTFASLCLEFTKAMVEKRLADVNKLPVGSPAYRADGDRGGAATADGRADRS